MTKPTDLDDEATFLAVNPAMDDDGVDDDAATRVVSSRAYVDDAEHAALLRELHAPSAPTARAPMPSAPFLHAGPSAVQDEPVGLGGTVILMPDAVPPSAAPPSSVSPRVVAPEPAPAPAPRASLPSIPASEPVPPILAEAPPQRAPALVVTYLAVCAVLTVLGLALLAWLKLQHRW